jgi:antitoxin PrlF
MATTVTSKGQVTIPKPVRDRLGIKPGNAVEFALAADGRVVLMKVGGRRPSSRFEARGRAGKGLSTDQIMALTRGEPGHDAGRYQRSAGSCHQ